MQQQGPGEKPRQAASFIVGIVADTHVPDRAATLHPNLIPGLRAAGVSAILHAGDVCVQRVLDELGQVAPVSAVRGNRDFALFGAIPWIQRLEFNGVPVTLVHGMGTWKHYIFDKFIYAAKGYDFQRYQSFMVRSAAEAKVIIFGHTHHRENVWRDGRLWFNPGSASRSDRWRVSPSYGLLHFRENGEVRGEIIELTGARLINRRWVISK